MHRSWQEVFLTVQSMQSITTKTLPACSNYSCLEVLHIEKKNCLICKLSCNFLLCFSHCQPKCSSCAFLPEKVMTGQTSSCIVGQIFTTFLLACFLSYALVVSQDYCAFTCMCSSPPCGFAVLEEVGTGFSPHLD